MENLTFANTLLSEYARLQAQGLPAIKEEKEVCEMCGIELEENDWSYEFDGGHKWCGSCFKAEKCQ